MNLRKSAAALVFFISAPLIAHADPRDDMLHVLDECSATTDEHARVACYDKLAPQLKSALGAPHKPTEAEQKSWFGFDIDNIFGSAPAQQTTPQQFGSESLPAPPPAPGEAPLPGPIDSITATVTNYAVDPFGKFVIFLDNDQVWQQLQGDSERAMFHKSGDTVAISRGFVGSYNLQINGSNKVFKVKRIK
jgi:hypothetical protein